VQIAIVILAFAAMIIVHELGHFLGARLMGMRVEKFSIGFGPSIFQTTRGDTVFQVGALPLGGFVRVAGMSPEDEVQPDDRGSYANHAAWRRFIVIAAGPLMNYAMAVLVLGTLLAVGYSEPDASNSRITVMEGRAAHRAGLRTGDRVLRYAGREVKSFAELREAISAGGEKEAPVLVEREGKELSLTVKPDPGPLLGVKPGEVERPPLPLHRALWGGLTGTWNRNVEVVSFLAGWIGGKVKGQLGGPVAIASAMKEQLAVGLKEFMQSVWNVSLAIGFFNLMPIPALDGGRLVFLGAEMVFRRRVNPRFEAIVHAVGLLLLFALILYVTAGDIRNLWR
jgi:regulator of sigma E protease